MSYLDSIDDRYLYGAIGLLGGWGIADILGGSELLGGAIGSGLGYYHGSKTAETEQYTSPVQQVDDTAVEPYIDDEISV